MKTNHLHEVVISETDMLDVIYRNQEIDNLVVDQPDWIQKYNQNCKEFGLPPINNWREEADLDLDQYIEQNLSDWSLPPEYAELDIELYMLSKCKTSAQQQRVAYELMEYEARGMQDVLRWMIYFTTTLRENNLVWGVGRGSSVSSYVLFLIGVHRVDSLKYELDLKEFLK
jgi:DNA polymerase III alpha subunit